MAAVVRPPSIYSGGSPSRVTENRADAKDWSRSARFAIDPCRSPELRLGRQHSLLMQQIVGWSFVPATGCSPRSGKGSNRSSAPASGPCWDHREQQATAAIFRQIEGPRQTKAFRKFEIPNGLRQRVYFRSTSVESPSAVPERKTCTPWAESSSPIRRKNHAKSPHNVARLWV
jgi:hypothetical protein